jgi:serine/threonine protein kinase
LHREETTMIEISALGKDAMAAIATAVRQAKNDTTSLVAGLGAGDARDAIARILDSKNVDASAAAMGSGRRIGAFEILNVLSKPGRPPCFEARDGEHHVVLKPLAGDRPLDRGRALAAQGAAAAAGSPALLAPLGFVVEGGCAYVVRPYLPGVSLAAIVETLLVEEVPPDAPTWRLAAGARGGGANVTGAKVVCRIGQYAAEALVALHAKGAVHGAVKLENLICDDTVKPTLVDAGNGHAMPPSDPPEVVAAPDRGAARGPASDLWALGAVMHRCLTRRPLFEGDAAAVERAITREKPASPLKANFKASQEMTIVTLALLERDPARRYSSAAELKADLDRYHTNEPIQRKAPGLFSRLFGG